MNYLLDTNACIALINGKPPEVRAHFDKAVKGSHTLFLSSVSLFELWYGVSKSAPRQANAARLGIFLAGPVNELPFSGSDAHTAGELRATLETMGRPIGAYDLLIAAQALCHNLILITANLREFSRIKDLTWQDWAGP